MRKTRWNWHGWRIGGLTLLQSYYYESPGRIVTLASWHNPARACWLWGLDVSLTQRDERKAFRIFRIPGSQARTVLQLWRLKVSFVWQVAGRREADDGYNAHPGAGSGGGGAPFREGVII